MSSRKFTWVPSGLQERDCASKFGIVTVDESVPTNVVQVSDLRIFLCDFEEVMSPEPPGSDPVELRLAAELIACPKSELIS